MAEVILSQEKVKQDRSQRKLFSFKDTATITPNETCGPTSSLYSIYVQLLESSIAQRKELQQSLLEINPNKYTLSETNSTANLKKVQLQINKLFIEIFKNNTQLKNVKQIEIIKK